MTPRRKPVRLTIAEKYDVILMYETGVSRQSIIEKYGISQAALSKIFIQGKDIKKKFAASSRGFSCTAKRISSLRTVDVDEVVLHWYLRCKERNVRMTEVDIQKKAMEINDELNGYSGFKASSAWLRSFQKRYRITSADIMEYFKPPTDFSVTEDFTANFNRLLQVYGLTLNNVYNVVYTVLMWKAVPEGTSILRRAKLTGSLKRCEDYITVLFCANATGCHKLPVLIIGNVPETQNLYNFNTEAFSTIYRSKSNVCMDSTIFTWWYKEHFLESVKERQKREYGRRKKSLLVVRNSKSLHDLDDLNNIDAFVRVMSSPLEVSPFIHPMNSGIIACFKRKYRKELVETITPLPIWNTGDEVIELHKDLSMWDCCRIVHDAWSYVGDKVMTNSWDNLLQRNITWRREYAEQWKPDVCRTLDLLRSLPGCELCEKTDVTNWFRIDNGYDIIKKICTDEVLEEFKNNTLGQPLNVEIFDDQDGPSPSKLLKTS